MKPKVCAKCGTVLYGKRCITVIKHGSGGRTFHLHFCSEVCANEFYLELLRRQDG